MTTSESIIATEAEHALLKLKQTHFVLWRPRITTPTPKLIIGVYQHGNPPTIEGLQTIELAPLFGHDDLWGVAARECNLQQDTVYHYWFEVVDSFPGNGQPAPMLCTDPMAWTVDWRILSPLERRDVSREEDRYPASVVLYRDERLELCDPGKETIDWRGDAPLENLPTNRQLIIYELPTSWASKSIDDTLEVGVGTFRDVLALVDPDVTSLKFAGIFTLRKGYAHIADLGINALELLPPSDSFVDREWGYATSNYFAADFDLGSPADFDAPVASTDLANLIKSCHRQGMRFFTDMVMAFATRSPYHTINFLDFFVLWGSGDPEEVVNGTHREGFGGDLFKYNYVVEGYDPESGERKHVYPARYYLYSYLKHWIDTYRIDGLRLDSVTNIANVDFLHEFKDRAYDYWRQVWEWHDEQAEGRFLVIGESLPIWPHLLRDGHLDALWNENFKLLVRRAILGECADGEPDFEWTVRKMIDCRLLDQGFDTATRAINYVTSHDVGGYGNERLYDYLAYNGIYEKEQRIKLAFACLLTALGIPMILAGEEFADQHDLSTDDATKQLDSVNFERREDPWRKSIFEYVKRLITLRREHVALQGDEVSFLHTDFSEGKRVLVWLRGKSGTREMVVVVANFSDYRTPPALSGESEYVVPNWPTLPEGTRWREVTQQRPVDPRWAGREAIFPWEAKVYAVVSR